MRLAAFTLLLCLVLAAPAAAHDASADHSDFRAGRVSYTARALR